MDHEQVIYHPPFYKVDKGIKPIVDWLNHIDGVVTHNSCEGNDDQRAEPYVMFTCRFTDRIHRILTVLAGPASADAECMIQLEPDGVSMRYVIRFRSQERLIHAIAKLERVKKLAREGFIL